MMNISSQEVSTYTLEPNYKSFLPELPAYSSGKILNAIKPSAAVRNLLVLVSTALLMALAVFSLIKFQDYFEKIHAEKMSNALGTFLFGLSIVLVAIQISFLLYILTLYFRYKAVKPVADELLPTCTVIVPAYNEGELVLHTLQSLAASDYPQEKLQIIAVDDGSRDDTWEWMKKAKSLMGDRLIICQQPENMGKRQALYRGFKMATGEVFITVDSDSVVKEDTLRNMASPFVGNDKCGAVAGNVRVLNTQQAIIPKMLNVSFAFSFEFVRSAQSVLGSVFCTPGALSAYRRDAVLSCLNDWMNQKFMGQPSDIGEDRAMTNMILKQGMNVVFQKNALVYTNTPETYKGLYKMFIRWERSNVRENIMMSKFAFSNFRDGAKAGTRILLLNQWLKTILSYPLTILMLFFLISQPVAFVCSALTGILIFSSIQTFFYAKRHNIRESFWAYPYSLFYTFALFWITPFAIATVGRKGWLTRTLPAK